jgi:hypothetical protein
VTAAEPIPAGPVFHSDGPLLVPTELATGPWFPNTQHGGAVAALVARAVERLPTAQPMQLTRLTLDLSRRVPLEPIRVDAEILRDGLRVQAVAVTVSHDGETVARGTALRLREGEDVVPPEEVPPPWPEDAPPPPPEEAAPWRIASELVDFIRCFDARRVGDVVPGRGTTWLRFLPTLVDDEPVSPTVRLAATCDFVMSAAGMLGGRYTAANPDLTVYVQRLPIGPWVCLQSVARVDGRGIGHSEATVSDTTGRIGRALKNVLVDRR